MKKLDFNQMQSVSAAALKHGTGGCIAAIAGVAIGVAAVVTMPATVAFLPYLITSMSYALSVKTAYSWCGITD